MTTPNSSSTGNNGGNADKSKSGNAGSKSTSKSKKAPKTGASKITRPYTSYNLFFQLEREYILQAVHGHQPTLSLDEAFDPTDRSNYQGPPLPTRYADLILPYDWHIPGKTQRRKRSHRKSHGKIGFHELNEQISKAWSGVDEETRRFCTRLSDAEGKKFKKIKKDDSKKTKKQQRSRSPKLVAKRVSERSSDAEGGYKDGSNDVMSFDWPSSPVPQEDVTPIFAGRMSTSPAPACPPRRRLSREVSYRLDEAQDALPLRDSCTLRDSLTEVDMDDDEIMELWDSIPVHEDKDDGLSGMCHACVEIPTLRPQEQPQEQSITKLFIKEEEGENQAVEDAGRMSFIDEEYERFKEIGKQFRTGRRNSTVAVGTIVGQTTVGVGGGTVGIPGTLTRKGLFARGA